MRSIWLAVLAGLVFVGALIAFLPARLVHEVALRPAGIVADQVTGPVWNARLYRVRVAGQPFAEARARLAFWPLLTGAARVRFEARDDRAFARGTMIARPGRLVLRDAALAAELSRVPGLTALPVPQGERIYGEIDEIVFRDGVCETASGTVSTPMLARLGPRYEVDLPEIEGTLGCAGAALGIGYQGRSEALAVTGSLRLDAQGYRWTSEARTGTSGVIAVLIALGFEEAGRVWRAEGEGSYR